MSRSLKEVISLVPEKPRSSTTQSDFINDEEYIDACQHIINDGLKNGYDILQMENGDIITTGTRVIVTQYRWDNEKRKMQKVLTKQKQGE